MYQNSAPGHPCQPFMGSYGVPNLYPQPQSFGYERLSSLATPFSRRINGQTNGSEVAESNRMPISLPGLFGGMRQQSCMPRGFAKEVTQPTKAGTSSTSASAQPRSSSVQVTLNDLDTWKSFDGLGNEMIVTKPGR